MLSRKPRRGRPIAINPVIPWHGIVKIRNRLGRFCKSNQPQVVWEIVDIRLSEIHSACEKKTSVFQNKRDKDIESDI